MNTSVWTNVCEEQTASKHFTSRVSWHCCSESGKFLAPKNCKTRIFHSRSSTLNFGAPASNFHQPPRQRKLRRSARVETLPVSIEFYIILEHERFTQDPQRFAMSWKKSKSHLTWKSQDPSSVSPHAAPVEGGHDCCVAL